MKSTKTNAYSVSYMKREFIFAFCSFIILMTFILLCREYFNDSTQQDQNVKMSILKSINRRIDLQQQERSNTTKILILVVVDQPATDRDFKVARDSLSCYAKTQNYTLEVVYTSNNPNFTKLCPQRLFMFMRHCVSAHIIKNYDWLLFVDGDIGVINPHHRIEEYIDDSVDVILIDRFFDWEVMTGSYLVKNSPYSIEFLQKLADYNFRLPSSNHGLDNGAIHTILMEELAPKALVERQLCERLLNKSQDLNGLFAFEACARIVLGANRYWAGKIKVITKGIGWSRDGWLTGTKFCTRDFMFHGWKQGKLGGEWVMPFEKPDDLAKCTNGLSSWATKPGFKISVQDINAMLKKKYVEVEKNFITAVGRLADDIVK